jgi:hypothetical protein
MDTNDITKDELAIIKSIYENKSKSWDQRMSELMAFLGKSERHTRKILVKLGFKGQVLEDSVEFKRAQKRKINKKYKRFLVTWAQNSTPIHRQFFENMKVYAKHIGADIHVIAGRYKNPTSVFTDKKHDIWDPEVVPYLDAARHNVHKYLSIISDVKMQPTTSEPLAGLEGVSGINSCVFGHPRVHMKVIPTLEGYKPKVMWTTGSVTVKNYTDSKNGKKGEFHHTLGFVVVEIKDKEVFYCRQVTATDKGDFCDLFNEVKDGQISRIDSVEAMVLGDVHVGEVDDRIMKVTTSMLDRLKPKHTMIHDLFNGHSISHHDLKNPFKQFQKEKDGTNVLKREIDETLDWVGKYHKYNLVIVRGNHDDFVDRWLQNTDWRQNVKNALEYMEYSKVLLENKAPHGIIPYLIKQKYPKVKTLGRSDSYRVYDWELAVHGDIGVNGSRGSLEQYRKMNTKCITAHSHTPGRKDGALAVGTMTKLRVGYNIGGSGWMHCHAIIHKNKKAQQILFIEGDYTTLSKQ